MPKWHSPSPGADEWLTSREAAALARLSPQTMANHRSRGVGPVYSKLSPGRGGRIRYRRSDVESWLASSRRKAA